MALVVPSLGVCHLFGEGTGVVELLMVMMLRYELVVMIIDGRKSRDNSDLYSKVFNQKKYKEVAT